ncbi:MAG: AMP-binding protein [Gammaproteobacteria bacterium]|nr:AMP-binding protein [Gammaproteobacteria bacterium]
MNSLPVLHSLDLDMPIFIYKDKKISHKTFKQNVLLVAENMQQHKYAINLCEDRYLFALAFVANIIQKNICLLPAHYAENEIKKIEDEYSDTQRLNDEALEKLLEGKAARNISFPDEININQVVAIVFTSGSSGKPKANLKKWGMLVDSAQRVAQQLNLNHLSQHTLVATVPPQHMYGFETTIIFPLVTGVCVWSNKPFFPEDIRQALSVANKPVILVTTPIHLRACVQAHLEWPGIDFVLSATAPLSQQLAQDVEKHLHTSVHEIYGCSEAGVIATRLTTQSPAWKLLAGYQLSEKLTSACLLTPIAGEEILLPDQIKHIDAQYFYLLGRQSDLIKIAGKRGSLNDLRIKLCSLEGVDDAVFFMPNEKPDEKARVAAFVIAPCLSVKEINSFLSQQVDHAFLPRPLIKVEKLPYNETGKLPLKNLVNLLMQYRNNKHLKDSA